MPKAARQRIVLLITVNVLDVLIGVFPDDETIRGYGFPVD